MLRFCSRRQLIKFQKVQQHISLQSNVSALLNISYKHCVSTTAVVGSSSSVLKNNFHSSYNLCQFNTPPHKSTQKSDIIPRQDSQIIFDWLHQRLFVNYRHEYELEQKRIADFYKKQQSQQGNQAMYSELEEEDLELEEKKMEAKIQEVSKKQKYEAAKAAILSMRSQLKTQRLMNDFTQDKKEQSISIQATPTTSDDDISKLESALTEDDEKLLKVFSSQKPLDFEAEETYEDDRPLPRKVGIYLLGLLGSGKTTVADQVQHMAQLQGWNVVVLPKVLDWAIYSGYDPQKACQYALMSILQHWTAQDALLSQQKESKRNYNLFSHCRSNIPQQWSHLTWMQLLQEMISKEENLAQCVTVFKALFQEIRSNIEYPSLIICDDHGKLTQKMESISVLTLYPFIETLPRISPKEFIRTCVLFTSDDTSNIRKHINEYQCYQVHQLSPFTLEEMEQFCGKETPQMIDYFDTIRNEVVQPFPKFIKEIKQLIIKGVSIDDALQQYQETLTSAILETLEKYLSTLEPIQMTLLFNDLFYFFFRFTKSKMLTAKNRRSIPKRIEELILDQNLATFVRNPNVQNMEIPMRLDVISPIVSEVLYNLLKSNIGKLKTEDQSERMRDVYRLFTPTKNLEIKNVESLRQRETYMREICRLFLELTAEETSKTVEFEKYRLDYSEPTEKLKFENIQHLQIVPMEDVNSVSDLEEFVEKNSQSDEDEVFVIVPKSGELYSHLEFVIYEKKGNSSESVTDRIILCKVLDVFLLPFPGAHKIDFAMDSSLLQSSKSNHVELLFLPLLQSKKLGDSYTVTTTVNGEPFPSQIPVHISFLENIYGSQFKSLRRYCYKRYKMLKEMDEYTEDQEHNYSQRDIEEILKKMGREDANQWVDF